MNAWDECLNWSSVCLESCPPDNVNNLFTDVGNIDVSIDVHPPTQRFSHVVWFSISKSIKNLLVSFTKKDKKCVSIDASTDSFITLMTPTTPSQKTWNLILKTSSLQSLLFLSQLCYQKIDTTIEIIRHHQQMINSSLSLLSWFMSWSSFKSSSLK